MSCLQKSEEKGDSQAKSEAQAAQKRAGGAKLDTISPTPVPKAVPKAAEAVANGANSLPPKRHFQAHQCQVLPLPPCRADLGNQEINQEHPACAQLEGVMLNCLQIGMLMMQE